jgi:hypothetical protein
MPFPLASSTAERFLVFAGRDIKDDDGDLFPFREVNLLQQF